MYEMNVDNVLAAFAAEYTVEINTSAGSYGGNDPVPADVLEMHVEWIDVDIVAGQLVVRLTTAPEPF